MSAAASRDRSAKNFVPEFRLAGSGGAQVEVTVSNRCRLDETEESGAPAS